MEDYKTFFEFEFPHVFSYADTRPGHTDKEKRNLIRQHAFKKCPDSVPTNACWGVDVSVQYNKKRKRPIDIDNIPKLIIDALCKKQIHSDKSCKYIKLGLYDDDTIDHVGLLKIEGKSGSKNVTKVKVVHKKQYKAYKREYLDWQNSAVSFYITTRLLWFHKMIVQAAFFGVQTLENLLKSNLLCHVKGYNPLSSGHNLKKMINILKNQVPNAKDFNIPDYFYTEDYQALTRYPSKMQRITIYNKFINDLDRIFLDLIKLEPKSGNFLKRSLTDKNCREYKIIKKKNFKIKELENSLFLVT